MRALAIIAIIALAGCGGRGALKPAAGERLPVAPYGATTAPTPDELMAPDVQARPSRSDELLTSSEERGSDPFDLPPR